MNSNYSKICIYISCFIFDYWKRILKTFWKNNKTNFQNQSLQTNCSNENWTTYCNLNKIIIVYNIVVIDRIEIFTIAFDIMLTTTNFKMFKISWMSFTKRIQKQQNLFCKMIKFQIFFLFVKKSSINQISKNSKSKILKQHTQRNLFALFSTMNFEKSIILSYKTTEFFRIDSIFFLNLIFWCYCLCVTYN